MFSYLSNIFRFIYFRIFRQKGRETFYKNVLPSTNIKDINKLENEYEGATGYIDIPNTNISYPIMQGEDNSYYLKHLPNGDRNKMGSIFLDYRNNGFNDKNTIIYGHNFNNGTMFSDLLNYKSFEFYKNHSNYKIYTSDKVIEVAIFAIYMRMLLRMSYQLILSLLILMII